MEDRYIMNPSPIPKFDNPKLYQSECLYLFGAGREKKIYAVPPHTDVVSLAFEDMPFEREDFKGKKCRLCGSANTYLDEMFDAETGEKFYQCSDTAYCKEVRSREDSGQQQNFCIIPELAAAGLDGLELNHHANHEKDHAIIRQHAFEYDLFLTGGSDFHGRYEGVSVDIGDYLAEPSGIRAILGGEEA